MYYWSRHHIQSQTQDLLAIQVRFYYIQGILYFLYLLITMNIKSVVSLAIRLAVAFFFLQAGIMKLGTISPEMAGFIGWAFHSLGLTFLNQATWVTVLGAWEILIWLGLVLGGLTRTAAVFAVIIMLGAMNAKWRVPTAIIKDILLAVGSLVIIILGAGQYSLDFKCCKGGSCCGWICGSKNTDPYKGKEVIEA